MARLAEYLARLATLFGNQEQVYFLKVRKGSAVSEIHVHETVASKVQARLQLVSAGNGPEDAKKSAQYLNAMLREDNASATLRVKGGAVIIDFPGCKTPLAQEASGTYLMTHKRNSKNCARVERCRVLSSIPRFLSTC